MALIVQGGLAATISGKVGNSVFARNRGGAYIRNYAKPTNPASPLQVAIRNSFLSSVNAWNTLNAAEQLAFNTLAVAAPQPNRVGLTSVLPPLSMFQKINVGRIAAGLDIVTTAPLAPLTEDWNPAAFSIVSISNSAFQVVYDGSSDWVTSSTQDALLVFLSPPQSFGKNFYKGKYNFFGLNNGSGGSSAWLAGLPTSVVNTGDGPGGSSGSLGLAVTMLPGRYFYRAYVTRADGHTGGESTGSFDVT